MSEKRHDNAEALSFDSQACETQSQKHEGVNSYAT